MCVVEASSHFVFLQASTSQSNHTHDISEDPSTYSFASGKNDASLECHICKTVVKSRQTLNDHIQGTHLSRYRYKCTFCGLGFKWRSMLSYHKRACPALAKPGFCWSHGWSWCFWIGELGTVELTAFLLSCHNFPHLCVQFNGTVTLCLSR